MSFLHSATSTTSLTSTPFASSSVTSSSTDADSSRLDFSCPNHASDLLLSLHSLLVDRLFCDVVFRLDDGVRFPAHKTVLSAASPYFKAMFSHGLAETDNGKKVIGVSGCEGGGGGGGGGATMEIRLPIISSEIFGAILEFIYTGQITLHEDNVQVRNIPSLPTCLSGGSPF